MARLLYSIITSISTLFPLSLSLWNGRPERKPNRIIVKLVPSQLQLFGSKVILAATHEQALLFPWERGWAGGQFDLVKSVSRSIKKMDHTSLSNVFDDLFMEPKQKRSNNNNNTTRTLNSSHKWSPPRRINQQGGWDGSFLFWGARSNISRQNGNYESWTTKEQSVDITTEQLIHESLPFQTED